MQHLCNINYNWVKFAFTSVFITTWTFAADKFLPKFIWNSKESRDSLQSGRMPLGRNCQWIAPAEQGTESRTVLCFRSLSGVFWLPCPKMFSRWSWPEVSKPRPREPNPAGGLPHQVNSWTTHLRSCATRGLCHTILSELPSRRNISVWSCHKTHEHSPRSLWCWDALNHYFSCAV